MKQILLENHHSCIPKSRSCLIDKKARNSCLKAKHLSLNLGWNFLGSNKNLKSCSTSRFVFQNSQILLDLSKAVLLYSGLEVFNWTPLDVSLGLHPYVGYKMQLEVWWWRALEVVEGVEVVPKNTLARHLIWKNTNHSYLFNRLRSKKKNFCFYIL